MPRKFVTMDGNEAAAYVAVRTNEVIAIYPITPSSAMGEWADQWTSEGLRNIWGTVPSVTEMQSEGGAAGAIHGALQTGSLATTFTASQGLLLMIPNMYKIAGELTPAVFHVTARTIATHALSIFGDHSDVMAARQTGWAMLCSNSVQEAHDFALIAQAATLESRVPFMHFFDGFRTSHEVAKIELMTEDDLRAMIDDTLVIAHRARALSPDHPLLRGTTQNPDVFFQAREAANPWYERCPDLVQKAMDRFAGIVGRRYGVFEYAGAPDAERVIVLMGSGCEAAEECVNHLVHAGEKVGLLKVRLYRPFDKQRFVAAIPGTARRLAVLDRTKEPGATGDPLYLDCVAAVHEEGRALEVVGGRYGLASKEFTPAMVKAVFDDLKATRPKRHFTVGIRDDVGHLSLDFDPSFSTESPRVKSALFYGLGADGTVGANKNSIKIIGENTSNWAQGYFVYDSKKSGAMTISHLRFGPDPIRSTYLVTQADFVACHQTVFLDRFDMLQYAKPGAVFLLNCPHPHEEAWDHVPRAVQQQIIDKKLAFYVIDALAVARESGMGGRINTVMQVCFFAIAGVLPREQAIEEIKKSIRKTYGKKGDEIVRMNLNAVDRALEHLHRVTVPATAASEIEWLPPVTADAPDFVRDLLGEVIAARGDALPVSAMPCDGTFPTGTARYEKRNIATEIPVWDADVCIQCGKCAMVCPHATIRAKVYEGAELAAAPATFLSTEARDREWKPIGYKFTIQVAPEDCTGCGICVDVCPAKNRSEPRRKAINMAPQAPLREAEAANWQFFLDLPEVDRSKLKIAAIPHQQLQEPLFEFSGACAGCGETPYLKLASQLFGDRMVIANATGCSSIYGGNLPTTPWTVNGEGRGPAWSNSLFEDNAEFGLGYRLSIDKQKQFAEELLRRLAPKVGDDLVTAIIGADQADEAGVFEQRRRVAALKKKLESISTPEARSLAAVADMLVRKSVWIVGGDGWAYDIGFGGLDHVLSSEMDVNVLVLDTEVYSNTGGQRSKSTPRGAVAKFAAGGKPAGKKDLGLIAMTYGHVYVASVAMGAKDEHTLRAFLEAESYRGPSLIIAYSHCIAHGINMATANQNQKAMVNAGQWLLYRHDPRRALAGENPLQLDSRPPKQPLESYLMMENRFKMLTKTNPAHARELWKIAQGEVDARFAMYEYLASRKEPGAAAPPEVLKPPTPKGVGP
jgi:pyruvate-ferredoxin/flavodoxin oxidoreductase